MQRKAQGLVKLFYPELRALFEIADRQQIDLFTFRGSVAGAFGLSQFLPTSYLKFAVDGDRDGKISLFDTDDAIASTANYLAVHGWKNSDPLKKKQRVIWSYNHSKPYIDTVLGLAEVLKKRQ